MPYRPIAASTSASAASAPSSVVLKRCGPSDCATISPIGRTSETGCCGSTDQMACWADRARSAGWLSPRTTTENARSRTANAVYRSFCCASGTYRVGTGGAFMPTSRTSPTMPTISRGIVSARSGRDGWPSVMRWPSGSAPGQIRAAAASLITTTGSESARSRAVNTRPLRSGICSASK